LVDLWQKLQIRLGMTVAILNAPTEAPALAGPFEVTGDPGAADAVLLYAANSDELASLGAPVVGAAREDRLEMTALGTDPVRQVSLDETWSALRFRPASR
jgi:hypothetical protein